MSSRLPDSKRNELIANYIEGNTDPDYEVIPSKTQKGKYTVRKRKVSLPPVKDNKEPEVPSPEPIEEQADTGDKPEEQEEIPDYPFYGYNPYLQNDYQMMLNKMMIEQMKMMRQQMKYTKKKQDKMKGRSKQIYDLLAEAIRETEKPEETPPPPQEEEEYEEEVEEREPPKPININTFESDSEEPDPEPEPETPKYKQDYERKIDEMGGFRIIPSRRDRLNFKNFNI